MLALSAFGQAQAEESDALRLRGTIPDPASIAAPSPMNFRIGRFESSPSCGVRCAEFIYAQGEIRPDTVEALMILQSRLKRALPVYFNSPGGNLDGGMALGRFLRKEGIDARVGALTALDCQGKTCPEADQRAGVTVFDATIGPAICNSSCVYAFAGGARRTVEAGSSLGVHRFFLARADDPLRRPISRHSKADLAKLQRTDGVLSSYLIEMGIPPEVLALAGSVDPSNVRHLSGDEMAALNLTTPGFAPPIRRAPGLDPAPTGSVAAILPPPPVAGPLWPMVRRAGRPFLVVSLPADSRRFGPITTEIAIGCPLDRDRYGIAFREIIQSHAAARQDATILIDPDSRREMLAHLAEPTPALHRDAALKADRSGKLVLQVTSTATAGHPTRLEFPGHGLKDGIERLDRACNDRRN